MKRIIVLIAIVATMVTAVVPFVTGGQALGSTSASANSDELGLPRFASAGAAASTTASKAVATSAAAAAAAVPTVDNEHLAQKPVPVPVVVAPAPAKAKSAAAAPTTADRRAAAAAAGVSCPTGGSGGGTAPSATSAGGVAGTTTDDIQSFSATYNAIRVANCLQPVPASNFRYDSCMEQRLFWMAEDPSTDPSSAWGHMGSVRSDGVPSVGCDGNLAGGSGNSGATVGQKWWDSMPHRLSLYRPSYTGSTANVCIYFAMTHGGIPNEPYSFTRAAARWGTC